MVGLQRALLVIAFLYILYHIYTYGMTTTSIIALVLLVLSFVLEVTRKTRRAKLEAYFARKEAELAAKEEAMSNNDIIESKKDTNVIDSKSIAVKTDIDQQNKEAIK